MHLTVSEAVISSAGRILCHRSGSVSTWAQTHVDSGSDRQHAQAVPGGTQPGLGLVRGIWAVCSHPVFSTARDRSCQSTEYPGVHRV